MNHARCTTFEKLDPPVSKTTCHYFCKTHIVYSTVRHICNQMCLCAVQITASEHPNVVSKGVMKETPHLANFPAKQTTTETAAIEPGQGKAGAINS